MAPHSLIALTAVVALAVSACADGGTGGDVADASSSPASATPSPASSTSTPSAGSAARQAALAAYDRMWRDWVLAGRTADYQSPALAQHAAGQALTLLVRGLYDAHRGGFVIKGEPTTSPRITALNPAGKTPSAAQIEDCLDATHWLNYTITGELQDDTPGGRHRVTATVGHLGTAWKVTRLRVQGVGTC